MTLDQSSLTNESPEASKDEAVSLELDLGLEELKGEPEPTFDHAVAQSKLKPDFLSFVKLMGIEGKGSTQEEVEADYLAKQTAFEKQIKDTIVPKIVAAQQARFTAAPVQGVPLKSSPQPVRKTRPYTGY